MLMLEGRPESVNHVSDMNCAYEWIIDSGVSHHMTGVLHTLTNIHPVSPSMVGLPNGKTVLANKKGSLVLTKTLTLKQVL